MASVISVDEGIAKAMGRGRAAGQGAYTCELENVAVVNPLHSLMNFAVVNPLHSPLTRCTPRPQIRF